MDSGVNFQFSKEFPLQLAFLELDFSHDWLFLQSKPPQHRLCRIHLNLFSLEKKHFLRFKVSYFLCKNMMLLLEVFVFLNGVPNIKLSCWNVPKYNDTFNSLRILKGILVVQQPHWFLWYTNKHRHWVYGMGYCLYRFT